jgi:hypothetical protein
MSRVVKPQPLPLPDMDDVEAHSAFSADAQAHLRARIEAGIAGPEEAGLLARIEAHDEAAREVDAVQARLAQRLAEIDAGTRPPIAALH